MSTARFLVIGCVFMSLVDGISAAAPNTVVLDSARLVDAKARLNTDPALKTTLGFLTAQADIWLTKGPWSVTNNKKRCSGDVHDYCSQAPYWWRSNTPDGCPYVQRDGVRNPEAALYTDHLDRAAMFQSSLILSLAWFYTGKEQYARKAGDVLRTWFITPTTRMNPHLNHAQILPCANTGRAIGIIDFAQGYTSILDAAAILASGAPGWSSADIAAFKKWNVDYLNWLESSQFGKDETAATNNHGTFAIMQSAAIALFTGNTALAKQKVLLTQGRINSYIAADGSLPQELARTRSYHYTAYTLVAYTRLASIGKKVGVDLWAYRGTKGQSIGLAVVFLLPAAAGDSPWAYPELEFERFAASDVVRASADYGNTRAKQAVGKLEAPPGGDLWLLRPASEQLDGA